jgi:hypothetical protein
VAKVYCSSVVAAPVGAVWQVVRNFNSLPNWTGFVADSRIEQNLPPDQVGCIRNFRLHDGGRIRERLLALSDFEMSCTYTILESPMGVENYVATLALSPVTESDGTFVEWTAEFDADAEREDELAAHIGRNVFASGLRALRQKLENR